MAARRFRNRHWAVLLVVVLTPGLAWSQGVEQAQPRESWWQRLTPNFGNDTPTTAGSWRGPSPQVLSAQGLEVTGIPGPYRARFDAALVLFVDGKYDAAAKDFGKLANATEDEPQEEECVFMTAESLYHARSLPKAQDQYAKLLKHHPTTRFLPTSVQRLYDIAHYWLEDARRMARDEDPVHGPISRNLNFFDRSRPVLDIEGRALQAIDTIQQYDPIGPITDDAVMMAAGHHFIRGRYLKAATKYEQVVLDQPKSEHAIRALILGAQCYMRAYQGPAYDGSDLVAAERLTKQALARSAELEAEQRVQLENDLATIHNEQAKRDYDLAEYYLQINQPLSARHLFAQVMKDHPNTSYADAAYEQLGSLESYDPKEQRGLVAAVRRVRGSMQREEEGFEAVGLGTPTELQHVGHEEMGTRTDGLVPPPPSATRQDDQVRPARWYERLPLLGGRDDRPAPEPYSPN